MNSATQRDHEERYWIYLNEFNKSLPAGTSSAERERLIKEALVKLVERDLQAIEEQAIGALDHIVNTAIEDQQQDDLAAARQVLAT